MKIKSEMEKSLKRIAVKENMLMLKEFDDVWCSGDWVMFKDMHYGQVLL